MSNFNIEQTIPNIKKQEITSENYLFKLGGFVMHPVYGIGHVESIEKKEIEGAIYNFASVSFQNEKGEPEIVEKVTILPPQSKMGTIDEITRNKTINSNKIVQTSWMSKLPKSTN